MMKRNSRTVAGFSIPVKIAVALILFLLVILPIVRMFSGVRASDFQSVFNSPLFPDALKNSVLLSLIATLISVIIAYILAVCTVRIKFPGKRIFSLLLTLPMLIPSISHGIGLTTLFGNNGFFTQLFGTPSIYGPVGIVAGSVMYSFPVAYIMLSDVLTYEDTSVYDAADILGIGKMRQFFAISLPYMKKALIATAFSTFSLIVTDYGVPVLIGGQTYTLSSLMYTEIAAATGGSFGKSTVYALLLLIPAVAAFITDLFNKEKGGSSFVKKQDERKKPLPLRIVAFCVCAVVSCIAILPIASFAVQAFVVSYPRDMTFSTAQLDNFIRQRGLEYLTNSLLIALATAALGTVLSYTVAYLTARMRSGLSRLIHLLALTFMAVPGLVLGLSYAMTFKETVIYGTVAIMIMANVAHFLSSPYLMMYNSFGKMNQNLEAVGSTLGVGRLHIIKDVLIPQSFSTVLEMFSYLFVNAMMTISAVSFLATTTTRPVSLMISQFKDSVGGMELAAMVSLAILMTNIILKGFLGIVRIAVRSIKKSRKEHKHDSIQKAI